MKTTLGFFGAGKMAEGILAAAALQKDFDPQAVLMAEKVPARAKELAKKYGVRTTPDAKDVAKAARVIFLAVRPQDIAALAADVKPLLTKYVGSAMSASRSHTKLFSCRENLICSLRFFRINRLFLAFSSEGIRSKISLMYNLPSLS